MQISNTPPPIATAEQQRIIIDLLNHPLITRDEQSHNRARLHQLPADEAEILTAQLRRAIDKRMG